MNKHLALYVVNKVKESRNDKQYIDFFDKIDNYLNSTEYFDYYDFMKFLETFVSGKNIRSNRPITFLKNELKDINKKLKNRNIDLSKCKKGDILLSSLGEELVYIGPTESWEYLDHNVKYKNKLLGSGTRTNDGYVMKHKRDPEIDHDIIDIIKK